MTRLMRVLVRAAMLASALAASAAQAAVTCSVSVTSMNVSYDPMITGDTVATGGFTISCTRLASDPSTLNWSLGANDGQQPSGLTNRVVLNGVYYTYEIYRQTPYTNANRWRDQNAGVRISGTLNFGAQLAASQNGAFDLRLAGPQTVQPAGTYTDAVTVTLRNATNNVILSQDLFGVAVVTVPTCVIATPPGSVSFAYTSFQAGAASASTSFDVRCTSGLPYTLSLDAASGTLLGLTYSLSLPQAGGTGTGAVQTYSINGSMPAGQSGTCATASCSASEVRTLTVSY